MIYQTLVFWVRTTKSNVTQKYCKINKSTYSLIFVLVYIPTLFYYCVSMIKLKGPLPRFPSYQKDTFQVSMIELKGPLPRFPSYQKDTFQVSMIKLKGPLPRFPSYQKDTFQVLMIELKGPIPRFPSYQTDTFQVFNYIWCIIWVWFLVTKNVKKKIIYWFRIYLWTRYVTHTDINSDLICYLSNKVYMQHIRAAKLQSGKDTTGTL